MEGYKIFIEGEELPLVKETFTSKEDSNSFISSFKVLHSENPFLIRKTAVSQRLLSTDRIDDTNKKKVLSCKVQQGSTLFNGKLIVLDVFMHTIKCDVSYYSDVFPVLEQELQSVMPVISVINDPTPDPYVEESNADIDDSAWEGFYDANQYNAWPLKDYCFPEIEHKDRYGVDLSEDDDWYYFTGRLNRYFINPGKLVRNYFGDADWDGDPDTPNTRRFFNLNTVVPCIFILSPLQRMFETIGYKITGDFVDSVHIQKKIIIPETDQNTKILAESPPVDLTFTGQNFLSSDSYYSFYGTIFTLENKVLKISTVVSEIGTYTIKIDVDVSNTPFNDDQVWCSIHLNNQYLTEFANDSEGNIAGEYVLEITPETVGQTIYVRYIHISDTPLVPISSDITITLAAFSTKIFKFHPTIELGRFVPEMNCGEYINALKNMHNLKISVDDNRREVIFDYNEDWIKSTENTIEVKELKQVGFQRTPNDSFKLSYAGDESETILIDKDGVNDLASENDYTKPIELEFNPAPHNGNTAELTENLLQGDGILISYFASNSGIPVCSASINGKTLLLNGEGGVYETDWKRWLKFRISATSQKVLGSFTEYEFQDIRAAGSIYFGQQRYLIKSLAVTQKNETYLVELEIESIAF